MYKQTLFMITVVAMLVVVIGCSDDDNGVTPDNNTTPGQSFTINASGHDNYSHFSFTTGDTVAAGSDWHLAFRREAVKLNGGMSGDGGVEGCNLQGVAFDSVTMADTTGASWEADNIDYFIDQWYTYNSQTHQLAANQWVYSMVDAEGDNYLKFRVDSMVGAAQPPDMGTVWITYFYQSVANSRDLAGTTSQASITVGPGTGYFDFSSGSQVTPADPAVSTDWDIAFHSYNLMQNSGPNGSGDCAGFFAWSELTDPTDIDGFTTQPSGAPMFGDIPHSTMTEWYDYDGQTHRLTSKGDCYLIKVDDSTIFKLKIDSYYTSVGGAPVSGYITITYDQL
ncbi:MAG: HmuY family protein [bacterium]